MLERAARLQRGCPTLRVQPLQGEGEHHGGEALNIRRQQLARIAIRQAPLAAHTLRKVLAKRRQQPSLRNSW